MEIVINKILLDDAIERVAKAIDQNPFIPAMKGIKVEVQDNKIIFIGSNGEISVKHTVETSLDAKIITPGIFLIELSMFRNIIKKLEGDLSLKSNDKTLTIATELDMYTLNLYDAFDYPEIDFEVFGDELKIGWEEWRNLIKNVSFAASSNENNLTLCCVNIVAKDGVLKMLATDRFRYAEETKNIANDADFNVSILAKNLKDLMNFEFKKQVTIFFSEHKLAFQVDGTTIQSKVIEQPYLDVSKILPTSFENEIIIEKRELANLLAKASVIITDSYNKIKFNINNKVLTISSTREQIAESVIKTTAFTYTSDEELKLTLNSKFLREAISVFEGELKISLIKGNQRIVITSASNPNNTQLFTPQKGF
ncbi:DNA polymerase-3 subunit beta [Metamycoplasma subdolum]|uniref:DNA polymerase-3 subunit beta n=1 Tax=Metamycoplasma subdolum TaxID=92407 RepID=A0A3M0A206_9BACT|nr:DNA polymerase III subunit beta [Metamycoplasma subdolum]RMA79013.1 DNA polymerase-3 subunit beta [Metamycoplasma subdolum]WPB50536.1 DNA polymerase III subunit beta [Metamycoplasma subdolum]